MEIVIIAELESEIKFDYSSEKEDLKSKIYEELNLNPRDIRVRNNLVKIYTGNKNMKHDNSSIIGDIVSKHFHLNIEEIQIKIN